MILSGQTIRALGIFTPFCERSKQNGMSYGLSAAGYDVRINARNPGQDLVLAPGEFALASTLEHFNMPDDVLGVAHDKSTWARQGLTVQNTVMEPGWRGYLTLELANHGPLVLTIKDGDPIAQIVLHRVDAPVETPYDGKYQDQGPGPQEARFESA